MKRLKKPAKIFLLSGALCVLTCTLYAFDSWEHEGLGNISLDANIQALQEMLKTPPASVDTNIVTQAIGILGQLRQASTTDPNKPVVTYGCVVKLVDYMKDNYELLHRSDNEYGWPTSPTNTNIKYLNELTTDAESLLSSSHVNQDHFQGRALYMFWFWHQQAVKSAEGGNLWGALLLNAYGDHFLQDSFAPGHLIAPRDENSYDLYSLMIHDSCNESGMDYLVQKPQQCFGALRMLLSLAESNRGETNSNAKHVELNYDAINLLLNAKGPIAVTCYGDGLINKNPRETALVSAYCVQSLHDVITSFMQSTNLNSFEKYRWNRHFIGSSDGQVEVIDVWQSFGDLTCLHRNIDEVKSWYIVGTNGYLSRVNPSEIKADIVEPLALAAAKDPAFGIDVGFQDIAESSGSHLQGLLEVETLIGGGRWDYLKQDYPRLRLPKWPGQFGLTLGYSGLVDLRSTANGALMRLVVPIPKLNAQISLYGGERYYFANSVAGFGDFEGVRAEWGFGLGNLFLGVGHDHYPRVNKQLVNGVSVQAGISFAFPWSRF